MPSQIGATLRDSHGIAQVKSVTGSKILRILKAHGNILLISLTHHFYGAVLNCFYGSSGFMILGNGVDRVCTGYAGGFVPPDLEGSVHQEALGEEQEGQRRQVQTDPSREQDPLPGPSLQEDKEALCNLEIVSGSITLCSIIASLVMDTFRMEYRMTFDAHRKL